MPWHSLRKPPESLRFDRSTSSRRRSERCKNIGFVPILVSVVGAVVSEVARRHGLNPQQVFGWRARLRDAVKGSAPSSDATPAFVPAIVESEPPPPTAPALPALVAMGAAGMDPAPIEIALGGVIVRVRGGADPRALTTVLKALRGRA